jgi:hypothetical protein
MNNNSSRNDWSNLTEQQVAAKLARIAQAQGWQVAYDVATENLDADEVDDLMRKARKWADRRRTW